MSSCYGTIRSGGNTFVHVEQVQSHYCTYYIRFRGTFQLNPGWLEDSLTCDSSKPVTIQLKAPSFISSLLRNSNGGHSQVTIFTPGSH